MTGMEAARRLLEIIYEIYDKLEEMEDILREMAPEEFEEAEVYSMAPIDVAFSDYEGWLEEGRLLSLEDILAELEEKGFGDEDDY